MNKMELPEFRREALADWIRGIAGEQFLISEAIGHPVHGKIGEGYFESPMQIEEFLENWDDEPVLVPKNLWYMLAQLVILAGYPEAPDPEGTWADAVQLIRKTIC